MKEEILKLLEEVDSKRLNINELKELLDVTTSNDFKELVKVVNNLVEDAVIIENKAHEYGLIKYTDFAVGISVGAKFVSKRGFIAEIYAGIGRDLLGESDIEVVGRGGISIGKRF